MKKQLKALIAVFSAALIFATVPLNALAASVVTRYVSEVKLAYGDTLAEAKQWLEGQGYEVLNADLNEKADSAFVSARAVCLGYKTTAKADEAITDMKVMNMKGNYSYDAYEMVLKEQAEQIAVFVKQLTASLEEYRENYEKGLYKAKAAHDLLNKILDDDTGKTMGDLLLNQTVQELGDKAYAALSDEEKANHADMVKILMQGNSQSTLAVEQYLCMASDTADDSFVDRLTVLGCYDDFEVAYASRRGIKDGAYLEKSLAADYDDAALIVAEKADSFKEMLKIYPESELFDEDYEGAVVDFFNKHGKEGDYLLFCQARTLYLALSAVEYEDGTLYDFFTSDEYDLKEADRYLLYPLVSVLSSGQRACLQYVSLSQLFENGIMDNDAWKTNYEKIKSEIIDESPAVSAYAGINRDLFKGGVALTNAAKQLNESTDDNYTDAWVTDSFGATTYLLLAGFAVNAVATIGCKVAAAVMKNKLGTLIFESIDAWADTAEELKDIGILGQKEITQMTNELLDGTFDIERVTASEGFLTNATRMSNKINLLNTIGNVTCVIMLIFAAATVGSAWSDIYDYYHTEKTPIPAYMVDEVTAEDGSNTYTYYSAVTCNRVEGGFSDDNSKILETYGDINGDIGREWLALYVTKDASAGKPIKAEFLCRKGTSTAEDKTALTMFGEKNAQNLVDEKYAFCDDVGGIYLFYAVGTAPVSGSVFTTGTIAMVAVAAAAVIAVVVIAATRGKKKKAAEAVESANEVE